MKVFYTISLLTLIFLPSLSQAEGALFNGHDLKETSIERVIADITPGTILIVGELHNNQTHHNNQLSIITALINKKPKSTVHLGMEFFNYTDQWSIYKYLNQDYSEEDFLKEIQWNTPETFKFYSPSISSINTHGGNVLGLNIPREITSRVAQNGIDSLDVRDLSLLPHPLLYGSDYYYERFYEAVGCEHVPEDKIQNYFWSQSIWDDVMSWKTLEFMTKNPNDIFVIFVGDFHVSYGGGLPEIFRRKGFSKIKTISQTVLEDDISPHPLYGMRADWIWVTD